MAIKVLIIGLTVLVFAGWIAVELYNAPDDPNDRKKKS